MISERENVSSHLAENMKHMNTESLVDLHNKLHGIIAKKLNKKEQYTLSTLLDAENELTQREME